MKKKSGNNWLEALAGAALIAASVLDVVPGDELIAVPIGIGMIAHSFGYLK